MEINKITRSLPNQDISTETEQKTSSPVSESAHAGIASVSDDLELHGPDASSSLFEIPASMQNPVANFQLQLEQSKNEITNYLNGQGIMEQDFPSTAKMFQSIASGQTDGTSNLFAVMMEYQKMVNKENREDKQLATGDARLGLMAKAAELDLESAKIDETKQGAGERFDNAMTQATTGMILGIASQATTAPSTSSTIVDVLKEFAQKITGEVVPSDVSAPTVTDRYNYLISWLEKHNP